MIDQFMQLTGITLGCAIVFGIFFVYVPLLLGCLMYRAVRLITRCGPLYEEDA